MPFESSHLSSVGPFFGLATNLVMAVLCLVTFILYRHYKPLRWLFLFYVFLSFFFLGYLVYMLQKSAESILWGYRINLAALALLPASWVWFASSLFDEKKDSFSWAVIAMSLLFAALTLWGRSPWLLGLPLESHPSGLEILRPQSKLLRPLVCFFGLLVCLYYFWLITIRLFRFKGRRPVYLVPFGIGLLLWFLGGLNDALLSTGIIILSKHKVLWFASFWLSISLTVAITLHHQAVERAAREAEVALRESEEKYRTILNSIEEGYYEVDLAGNFTFSNDFLAKSLGYTREELRGLNNRRYMSPETAKLVFNTFNEVYRTGNTKRDFEWELINKDGTKRFVEVSVSLMRGEKGEPKGFYGLARDITERKQAEEQERDFRSAKDKVLHHLSHELRTPVSVIQGNIRILKRKIQKQTPPIVGEEIFDLLERNLGRLSHIQLEADEIIRFYGEIEKSPYIEALVTPPSTGVERISSYYFAQEVLGEVKEKAGHRDIQIALEGPKDLTLNTNPRVLEGMFIGLLKNAIENTPDEGEIRVVFEQKAQWLQLKFVDFGIGITKENQRRLFDGLSHTLDTELYRSKKPYDFGAGGKGLDLLRMKVYSKRFGFDISAASQRCLYLPTDRDLCPGRISECPHCRVREDCFNSGGSTFCLTFTVAGDRG